MKGRKDGICLTSIYGNVYSNRIIACHDNYIIQ